MSGANLNDAVKFYKRNGYCHIEQCMPVELIDKITYEIDELFSLQLRRMGENTLPCTNASSLEKKMEKVLQSDVNVYLATARHASKLLNLNRLVVSREVSDLVSFFGVKFQSLPTTPVLHIVSDRLKIPGGYYGVAPHQDWPSIQGGLDTITMWIPFFDVSEKQFPLEVIPGTHKLGLLEGRLVQNALEVSPDLYKEEGFVTLPARKGDVILMSGFLIHRTGLKNCSGLRIASSTRYENCYEPTFVERGYPCAYQRVVQRELINKDFPSVDQVASLYNSD
jgi:hypothetical protein